MPLTTIFLVGVMTSAITSLLVVAYLRRPLRAILTDLCGTVERANFWLAFSNVTLVLVPLIFALSNQPEMHAIRPVVLEVGAQLRQALVRLAASVVILGIVIGSFIPRGRPKEASNQLAQSAEQGNR